jgi:hypothetical protein
VGCCWAGSNGVLRCSLGGLVQVVSTAFVVCHLSWEMGVSLRNETAACQLLAIFSFFQGQGWLSFDIVLGDHQVRRRGKGW